MLSTFRWRIAKEPKDDDVDLLQSGVLRLYYVLRGLKVQRDRLVSEDYVGGSQLSVHVEKDFGLKYPSKAELVDEIEIRGYEVLVCKNPRNESVIKEGFIKQREIKF